MKHQDCPKIQKKYEGFVGGKWMALSTFDFTPCRVCKDITCDMCRFARKKKKELRKQSQDQARDYRSPDE